MNEGDEDNTQYHLDYDGNILLDEFGEPIPMSICICAAYCSCECCCGSWDGVECTCWDN